MLFVPTPAWMKSPAVKCKGKTNLFYPNEKPGLEVARAKAICNGTKDSDPCPFRDTCLQYAIDNHEAFGVWGGTSERERRKIQRARRQHKNPRIYTLEGVRFPGVQKIRPHGQRITRHMVV